MVKRTANIIDRQSKFLRYFIVQENIKENKMYYKELFEDKAQRKDRLKNGIWWKKTIRGRSSRVKGTESEKRKCD